MEEILQSVVRDHLRSTSMCMWLVESAPDLLETREKLEKVSSALSTTEKTLAANGRLCVELEGEKTKAIATQKIAEESLLITQEDLEKEKKKRQQLESLSG